MYELWTGLYMLDPWEKIAFSEYLAYLRVIRHKSTQDDKLSLCRFYYPHDVWGPRLLWIFSHNWGLIKAVVF